MSRKRPGQVLTGQGHPLVNGHDPTAIPIGVSGSGSMPMPPHRRHGPSSGLLRSPTQVTQIGAGSAAATRPLWHSADHVLPWTGGWDEAPAGAVNARRGRYYGSSEPS